MSQHKCVCVCVCVLEAVFREVGWRRGACLVQFCFQGV